MRVIAHLSDLHFGRVDHALLEPLRRQVTALRPHVVVVSGDLTQRARSAQFREARAFLDTLPSPRIVVPGNHDVPLYNVYQRFFQPLDKFRRFVEADLEPSHIDDEVAVVGVNTTRSLVFKGGRINEQQLGRVKALLCSLPESVVKIVVTHHPFDLPPDHGKHAVVGRAAMAMRTLLMCGADMVLSGHLHTTHTGHSAERYRIPGHSALIVQAGTATSTRERGEANSFNALHVEAAAVRIERYVWQPERKQFVACGEESFERTGAEWKRR